MTGDTCPRCGLSYADFRTGYTYADIFGMFWVGSDDPAEWVYKRRHTVLGKWHQIKLELWSEHLDTCDGETEWI